eukprot:161399-Pyramimonas_sp.AAC.1
MTREFEERDYSNIADEYWVCSGAPPPAPPTSPTLHYRLYSCSRPDVAQARSEPEVPSQCLEAARAEPDLEIFTRGIH